MEISLKRGRHFLIRRGGKRSSTRKPIFCNALGEGSGLFFFRPETALLLWSNDFQLGEISMIPLGIPSKKSITTHRSMGTDIEINLPRVLGKMTFESTKTDINSLHVREP